MDIDSTITSVGPLVVRDLRYAPRAPHLIITQPRPPPSLPTPISRNSSVAFSIIIFVGGSGMERNESASSALGLLGSVKLVSPRPEYSVIRPSTLTPKSRAELSRGLGVPLEYSRPR